MTKTLHLIIHGRVQGVGYRAWTVVRAKELHLSGWVRNRSDGTVEAVIIGEEEALGMMIRDCNDGPPAARVVAVDVTPWTGPPFKGFVARETV